MFLLFAACAARAPLTVFPAPIPDTPTPLRTDYNAPDDVCPSVAPFVPDRPAPYLVEGLATCRGQVVPEDYLIELLYAQDAGEFWQAQATLCHDGRVLDRRHADAMLQGAYADSAAHRRDARVLRWVTPVGIGGGVVLGVLIGAWAPQ